MNVRGDKCIMQSSRAVEESFLPFWVREVAYDDNLKDGMNKIYLMSIYNDFWQGGGEKK